MPTSRKIFVVAASALACHFVAIGFHSALASSVIEFVLLLLAVAACFEAAARAEGDARGFWRVMGIGVALYRGGQILSTCLKSFLHRSRLGGWPKYLCLHYHYGRLLR